MATAGPCWSMGTRVVRAGRRSNGIGASVAPMKDHAARMAGRKIGFVGGGNMAGALVRGLLQSRTVTPDQIRASDVKEERLAELHEKFGIHTTADNEDLCQWADVVV